MLVRATLGHARRTVDCSREGHFQRRWLVTSILSLLLNAPLVAALMTTPSPALCTATTGQVHDDMLICAFEANVDAYVQLHRRLERTVPPQVYTSDLELLFMSRKAMAIAMRRERPLAKQGDIFSPPIAAMFRQIVEQTLRADRVNWGEFLAEDGMTLPIEVVVNGDYPAGGPVSTMTPTLLKALPPLPPELQYRFVNLTLVLWDVHAGLIVDFVPNIFGRSTPPVPVWARP
jgi:hypothetical protein